MFIRVTLISCLTLVANIANAQFFFQALPSGTGAEAAATGYAGSYSVGSIFVGSNKQPCRWLLGGAPTVLPLPVGSTVGLSTSMSDSGDVIGGYARLGTSNIPYLWNSATNVSTNIGLIPGFTDGFVWGVSGDGLTAVGSCEDANHFPSEAAYIWTTTSGMVRVASGYPQARLSAISRDSSTAVGSYQHNSIFKAFSYNIAFGLLNYLGDLPGGANYSTAYGVASAGDAVVGNSQSTNGLEAFLWKPTTGMAALGDLPGGNFYSRGLSCSKSGQAVVGFGSTASGLEAFFWNGNRGMTNLRTFLVSEGINLNGWTAFGQASSISEDSKVIVGTGLYNGVQTGFRVWCGQGFAYVP